MPEIKIPERNNRILYYVVNKKDIKRILEDKFINYERNKITFIISGHLDLNELNEGDFVFKTKEAKDIRFFDFVHMWEVSTYRRFPIDEFDLYIVNERLQLKEFDLNKMNSMEKNINRKDKLQITRLLYIDEAKDLLDKMMSGNKQLAEDIKKAREYRKEYNKEYRKIVVETRQESKVCKNCGKKGLPLYRRTYCSNLCRHQNNYKKRKQKTT